MPIYEFKCPNGEITERMARPNTNAIMCPKCHQKAKKILSLCSFKLKGSGWYADGYSSKKNANKKDPAKRSQSQESKTENGRAP